MEILSRKEAAERGQRTYFTGQPCKNGHTAYRYVQSGTCSQCIRAAGALEASESDRERKAARDKMVQVKLVVHDADLPALKAAALAFAAMRCPQVQESDVYPNLLATNRTVSEALHRFNCFQEDIDALRAVATALHAAHPVHTLERDQALASLQAAASNPIPEWTFK